MTRIVIADDHAVVRKGLRVIADADELHVAGEAASADELMVLLRTRPVNAVLLDVSLGDRDGIEVLRENRRRMHHGLLASAHHRRRQSAG